MNLGLVKKEGDVGMAEWMREVADEVEAGTVTEIVVICNNVEDRCFYRKASFENSWKLLGALEYARYALFKCLENISND